MKFLATLFYLCFFAATGFMLSGEAAAQGVGSGSEAIDQQWVSPRVVGSRRNKGFQLSYNLISPFSIKSTPTVSGINEAEARIQKLEEIQLSLRLPISWKGRTIIAAGVDYLYEEYNFQNPSSLDYDFYTNLENKHLNSLDGQVFILHALNERSFIGSRLGLEFNGDYKGDRLPFLQKARASVALIYGWKPNPYTVYGLGAYYSYTWGSPALYPIFVWNKTFNERWGIEAVLPQSFRLRRNLSEKSIFLLGSRVSGRSYHIISEAPPLREYPFLELQNSNVYFFLEYEQELYDFLWFGFNVGYRYNVNFNIVEENIFRSNRIIENEVGHSPYFNVSLFLVPPRSWLSQPMAPSPEER